MMVNGSRTRGKDTERGKDATTIRTLDNGTKTRNPATVNGLQLLTAPDKGKTR